MDEQKPFLVKSGCWLLDPPHDSSRIVQRHMSNLVIPTTELADFQELKLAVEATLAMLDYQTSENVNISSQCNRLMKHFQSSAIYLACYEDIATVFVKSIHQAMAWLFDCRPPREIAAEELLAAVSDISRMVLKTAKCMFFQLKKMQAILTSCSDGLGPQSVTVPDLELVAASSVENNGGTDYRVAIVENVSKFLSFWEKLTYHFYKIA